MKVTALLCDHAVVAEGKLYISGGGWSLTGPAPTPMALAVKIDVPWDRTNSKIKLAIELFKADGQPVLQVDQTGTAQPTAIKAEFEVGRPPGVAPGSTIDVPLAFSLAPMQLPPSQRFVWRITVDDEAREDWELPFSTRPPFIPGLGFPGMAPGMGPP